MSDIIVPYNPFEMLNEKTELRKKALEKYRALVPVIFGGPGSGRNPEGGGDSKEGGGDNGKNIIKFDPKEFNSKLNDLQKKGFTKSSQTTENGVLHVIMKNTDSKSMYHGLVYDIASDGKMILVSSPYKLE